MKKIEKNFDLLTASIFKENKTRDTTDIFKLTKL